MIPSTNSGGLALRSKTRRDMVETIGRLTQLLGLPRSTGQIYGLLYLSPDPLSLEDMADLLSISKGSASIGTRQLLSWGAIGQVWVPGERKDYFQVMPDLSQIIYAGLREFINPRLKSAEKRVSALASSLDQDLEDGSVSQEEYNFCRERLGKLTKIQETVQRLAPFAEELLK